MKDTIIQLMDHEFGGIAQQFTTTEVSLKDVTYTESRGRKTFHLAAPAQAVKPGVYIFWKSSSVIRIGRSKINAIKRALQHLTDDTDKQMACLANDSDCHLVLITMPTDEKFHWIVALEFFLEEALNPLIPPRRHG